MGGPKFRSKPVLSPPPSVLRSPEEVGQEQHYKAVIAASVDFLIDAAMDMERKHTREVLGLHSKPCETSLEGAPVTITRWGIGCDCPRDHFCGHCIQANRGRFLIREDNPCCPKCGTLTAKDVITVYPEGHNCGKR
jgi:hypothetical protein